MKTKRLISIVTVFALAGAITSPLFVGLPTRVRVSALEEEIETGITNSLEECQSLIQFITDNFGKFVNEYNLSHETEQLYAQSIEYSAVINLYEDKNYGVYLDFDGDNGFMVSTADCNIYELKTQGDLAALRELEDVYYSYTDGFLYWDEEDTLQKIVIEKPEMANLLATQSDEIYPGQKAPGDGEIALGHLSEYINERYPDMVHDNSYIAVGSSDDFLLMNETAYYVKVFYNNSPNEKSRYPSAQGDCALTAMFNVMNYWARHNICNLPDFTVDIYSTIEQDQLYSQYGTGVQHNTYEVHNGIAYYNYCWLPNKDIFSSYPDPLTHIPRLYTDIRYVSIYDGYTPEYGLEAYQVLDVMRTVLRNYGNSTGIIGNTMSDAMESMRKYQQPFILLIDGSSTYGKHAVTVTAYSTSKITSGWWIFQSTTYYNFYTIFDGWNEERVYFDPNTEAQPKLQPFYLV